MRVFKYRGGSFERDVESLVENYFWAPTRDALNDPCEGIFDRDLLHVQLEELNKLFFRNVDRPDSYKSLMGSIESILSFVDKCGIYSLSKTPLEELLWAHYSNAHTGFCIEYELDRLVEFEKEDYHKIPVSYSNSPQSITIDGMLSEHGLEPFLEKVLGNKSDSWSYESELRIVPSTSGKHEYDYRAVKSIYFGLRMKNEEKLHLMNKLQGRDISYFNVELENGSYNFSFSSVTDEFFGAYKYRSELAELPEDAIIPDLVHENYKSMVNYLYKAAEIVRHEPYCNRIDMVEFSTLRGTPENPVILVQYERKKHRYINHYLTIPEIEVQYEKVCNQSTV